jgi:peroxiredoxin
MNASTLTAIFLLLISTLHVFSQGTQTTGQHAHGPRHDMIGKPLPYFRLKDLDGNVMTSKDLKGKPVVINLWFTACRPCISEMPELNRIKSLPEYADVAFLAITFETRGKVRNFLKRKQFDFHQLVDGREYCNLLTDAYPRTIFVDKNGIVTDVQQGIRELRLWSLQDLPETRKWDSKNFIRALNVIAERSE